jgi:hypothetical protein
MGCHAFALAQGITKSRTSWASDTSLKGAIQSGAEQHEMTITMNFDSKSRKCLTLGNAFTFVLLPVCLLFIMLNPTGLVRFVTSDPRSLANELQASPAQKTHATELASMAETIVAHRSDHSDLVIDFISVGTIIKPDLQATQARTFGAHPAVRNFFQVTELNDTDMTCFSNFTDYQLIDLVNFCNNTVNQTPVSAVLRTRLFWPNRHTAGWVCAQKRPIDGLHIALSQYKTALLPSFLLIIDDDTYVNMDAMVKTLREAYPEDENRVVAGCRLTYPKKIAFAFPIGGFGSILTRGAVERLMKPIYCDGSSAEDDFTRLACWRLNLNHVGEKDYFKEGMSIGDLMYKYSAELPFTRIDEWNGTGYCFHSDHTLGYFFNFYHIGAPLKNAKLSDDLRVKYSYEYLVGESECKNEKRKCNSESRICHYVQPEQMETLHSQQRAIPTYD